MSQSRANYWLVEYNNENGERKHTLCGSDLKVALDMMWKAVKNDSTYMNMTEDQDEKEYEEIKQRVYKEHRFFVWSWESRSCYKCAYLLEGTATSVTDKINFDKHFVDWNYGS